MIVSAWEKPCCEKASGVEDVIDEDGEAKVNEMAAVIEACSEEASALEPFEEMAAVVGFAGDFAGKQAADLVPGEKDADQEVEEELLKAEKASDLPEKRSPGME
ncbi:hypothetical protein MLD38_024074 [Melastoma candidum]|uniref:Uncharacterized protein n=1 Tax=Melastoma candidum TaxID=119954 RepID=A0ACB9NUL4_9MYRT|nr:hypothetical protein MLD38_024074 [Melastoma candidum]